MSAPELQWFLKIDRVNEFLIAVNISKITSNKVRLITVLESKLSINS